MTPVRRLLSGRIFDASLVLAIALLAGRLTGIVREFLLAGSFGVSAEADLAVLLLTLPDLLVGLLLAGGLSAALVPRFRRLDEAASATLFRHAALAATAAFAAAGMLLAIAPNILFRIFAPGMADPSGLMSAATPTLVAIALPLTAASGVVTAFLNARDRYFVAGLGTLIFNLVVICGLLVGGDLATMLRHLAIAIAVGALLRLASQIVVVPSAAWRTRSPEGRPDAAVARAFAAGIGATGLALLAPVLVRAAASLLGPGTIAAFNYAQKLTELPVGILITTISTVALTSFGGLVAQGDDAGLTRDVARRLRQSLLTAVAVVAFGVSFAHPFVHVVLGRSALEPTDLDRIATLTMIALASVPFVAVSSIATALLNAQLRTGRVLAVNGIAIAVLPLLALPGILMRSDMMLMASVSAFQYLAAALLANAAGIGFGFATRGLILTASTIIALAAVIVFLAAWADLPDWAALGTGGAGFAAAMFATRRGRHETVV